MQNSGGVSEFIPFIPFIPSVAYSSAFVVEPSSIRPPCLNINYCLVCSDHDSKSFRQ